MANGSRTYRTALEIAVISIIIYLFLRTPGTSSSSFANSSGENSTTSTTANKKNLFSTTSNSKAKIEHLVYPSQTLQCPRHEYVSHIYSTTPLVVYIEGFLSKEEVKHLIGLSEGKWDISTIFNAGVETTDSNIRKSEKAAIERDTVVRCIEQRALAFQGWPKDTFIERLWTQRYNVSGHYSLHYDWAHASKPARRVSSFMVYLACEACQGGGTNFPRIPRPDGIDSPSSRGERGGEGGNKWCEFINCGQPEKGPESGGGDSSGKEEGVTFKPVAGNAVFWMNFDSEGRGYKETIHAGMPVLEGQKIGLNIWSWYQAGHRAPEAS